MIKLLNYKIPTHADDWYLFRSKGLTEEQARSYSMPAYAGGIGGSESGGIMNMSSYISALEIFYQKIGYIKPRQSPSEPAMWGLLHEKNIKKMWMYYNGEENYVINLVLKNQVVRKCRSRNGYYVNPMYPFMFASPDAIINKGQARLDNGEINIKEGVLEFKSINSREVAKWESGVPEYYKYQILHYLIVFALQYAEIAMLIDGSKLKVYPLEFSQEDRDRLLDSNRDFFYNKVIPGRNAYEAMMQAIIHGDKDGEEEHLGIIHELEPDPSTSMAYEDFMKEIAIRDVMSVNCEEDQAFKQCAINYAKASLILKVSDEQKQYYKNMCMKKLHDLKTEKADFGDLGYTRMYEKSNGTVVFDNRIKFPVDKEMVEEGFNKLRIMI